METTSSIGRVVPSASTTTPSRSPSGGSSGLKCLAPSEVSISNVYVLVTRTILTHSTDSRPASSVL